MPKSQMLALGTFSGTFVAFAVSGGSAMVYLQNLIASFPGLPF